MSATIHSFPTLLTKVTRIRGLADDLAQAVEAISPDNDLTVPALCSVLFEIVANASDPELGRRAARSMRVVAALIEENIG